MVKRFKTPNNSPKESAPTWAETTLASRISDARLLLAYMGFMSDAENERITKRIQRWHDAHRQTAAK